MINNNDIEEMRAFFAKRVETYDDHMLTNIEQIEHAYLHVAQLLPDGIKTLLDLGCGTGLELRHVFERFPKLSVTGIDLTQEMLDKLGEKYKEKQIHLICGDYFAVDLGQNRFDAALSFQTIHHFTHNEKLMLYRRIYAALAPGGVYVEADYTAEDAQSEQTFFAEKQRLLQENSATGGLYHIDTPMTAAHQLALFEAASFSSATLKHRWGNTAVFIAKK